MYSSLQLAKKYFQYWLKASNGKGHGVHSPFVYDFISHVLNAKTDAEIVQIIEQKRNALKQDNRLLTLQDFGAGSAIENQKQRTVASIAKTSLKSPKYAQLICKIARYFKPKNILELGTCLGITTSYISKAAESANIISMEGASEVAKVAQEVFQSLSANNIQIIEGNFDETLPKFISRQREENKKLDFVFIDGNHREQPTINYFKQLLPLMHNDSVMIFDDVHWSKGMENAWEIIQNNEAVTLSIDLFFIGLIFFRKEQKVKQHFTIRY